MRRKGLRVLYMYNGIFMLAANLLVPIYSVYTQQFQSSVFSISLVWGVFLVSTTLFSLLLTWNGERIKKQRQENFLMIGYLVRVVVWLSFIFIGNLWQLMALQVLLGLGEALGSPAFDALFSEKLDSKNRLIEYSRWKVFSNLMTAIGTVAGGAVVSWLGFPVLFVIMAFLALVSFGGILISRVHLRPMPQWEYALQPAQSPQDPENEDEEE